MAVEIPVIVDIEGAFQEAASRVKTASKPLQRAISDAALDIPFAKIKIDKEDFDVTLRAIKDQGAETFGGLSRLIEIADRKLVDLAATGKSADFKALLEAAHYMRDMRTAAEASKYGIIGLAQSMEGLQAKVSAAAATIRTSKLDSPEWQQAAKDMAAATAEVEKYEQRIQQLGQTKGSLSQMNAQLQQLQQQWANMAPKDMFKADGTLTDQARALRQEYTVTALQAEKVTKALAAQVDASRKQQQEAEELRRVEAERAKILASTPKTLDEYTAKIQALRATIQSMDTKAPGFEATVRQLNEVEKAAERVKRRISELGMAKGSIDSLNSDLQRLKRRWESMAETEMFDPSGKLTQYGKATRDQIVKITKEMERRNKVLNEQIEKERLREAERKRREDQELRAIEKIIQKEQQLADQIKKTAQQRKYEAAVLNTTKESMKILQAQEKILSDRLASTATGTQKYKDLETQLQRVRNRIQELNGGLSTTTGILKTQSRVMQNLTMYASMYLSVFGAFRFVKQIRDVTAELEYQRVALQHLIQDEEYGAHLFEEIKKKAVESPFRIKDLVGYTKQLAAYRVEQEYLVDTTSKLADVSAGLGVDMNRLILAYGQVRAASVLRGQELRQFTEAGIPLVDLLAEKMGELRNESLTTADVFKLISERAVPFSAIADIFEDLTEKGGMFYKMQETQAETLKGRWEKLKDIYDLSLQSIGESKGLLNFNVYNNLVLGTLKLLAKNLRVVPKLLEGYAVAMVFYKVANIKATRAMRQLTIAEYAQKNAMAIKRQATIMGIKNVDAYTAAIIRQRTATGLLTKAFWGLRAAMIANPWGFAISAIAAVGTAIMTFTKRSDDATESLNAFKKAVETYANQLKEADTAKKLIDRYRMLAENTERTAKQNQRLATTIERLKDIYPEFTEILDNNNLSADKQADAMLKIAEAAEKANKGTAMSVYNEMKTRYDDLDKDYKDAQRKISDAEKQARTMRRLAKDSRTDEASYERQARMFDRQASKLREKILPIKDEMTSLQQAISRMEFYLFPEKALDKMEEWRKTLHQIQKENFKAGQEQVFTKEDVDSMTSVFDLSKKLKKRIEDLRESIKGMKEQIKSLKPPADINKAMDQIADKEKVLKVAELIKEVFGFLWPKGGGYQQDPWIMIFKNRLKFVQDFSKGVQDMNKYMSETDAIAKMRETMEGRGLSLGFNGKDDIAVTSMTGSRAEVMKWYDDTIKKIQDKIAEKGGAAWRGLGVQAILAKDTKSRMIKAWQDLLAEVFKQKTDFDLSQTKKDFETAMKKLKDEIKRSDVARNFYQDILDLTGNKELATNLTVGIYGEVGESFQKLVDKELQQAMNELDPTKFDWADWGDLSYGIATQDFSIINKYLDKFPEAWRDRLKEMAADNEKFNADFIKGLYQRYKDEESFENRRANVSRVEQQKRDEIKANTKLSDKEKADLTEASKNKEAKDLAKIDVEELKATYEWTRAFQDLDRTSTGTLSKLKTMIAELIEKQKEFLSPEQLKALTEAYEKIQTAEAKRTPFTSISDNAERASLAFGLYQAQKSGNQKRIEKATKAVDEYNKKAKKGLEIDKSHAGDAWKDSVKNINDAVDGLEDYIGVWQGVVSALKTVKDEIKDALGADEIPIVDEAIESMGTGLQFIASILPVITALQAAFNATAEMNPIIAIATAVVAVITLIIGLVKGVMRMETERLNDLIEKQKKLVDRLKESYDELADAAEEAFGAEYIANYTQRIRALREEIEAYRKMAEYEKQKPLKDFSEEDYEEYLKNMREEMRDLNDLQKELTSKFLGSDRATAAQDFADAWIDAYKEFGSTADAIKDKFKDMMQNMVVQSLAANVINKRLEKVFDMVESLSKDDQQLSIDDAAQIAEMMMDTTEVINSDLNNLMNALSSARLDLRTMGTGMSGIARDIQGASEESILGLAAGINTQNFFMSQINDNVLAILQHMRVGSTSQTGESLVEIPYVQTQEFSDRMRSLDENLALLLSKISNVIVTTGTTSPYYVQIK